MVVVRENGYCSSMVAFSGVKLHAMLKGGWMGGERRLIDEGKVDIKPCNNQGIKELKFDALLSSLNKMTE